jgi:hypothetical protein
LPPADSTGASGRARLTLKLGGRGLRTISGRKAGFVSAKARLRVR